MQCNANGNANNTQLMKLQKIQNKIVKILFQDKPEVKVTNIMAKEKILNIKKLKEYVILLKHYFNYNTKFLRLNEQQYLRVKRFKLPNGKIIMAK